jgi:methionyl-tRNA formyltransferase
MNGEILVFAGKQVGLELVAYLLDINAPISQVIVGTAADEAILDLVAARQIPSEVHTRQTQARLVEEGHRYEWLLNFWSPHILRPPVLALAKHRLNVHPSLVPHCRGNDNAAWTIREGLPAGVSLIEMEAEVDVGGVYVQREVPYSFPIRGRELHSRLQQELVMLFKEYWPAIFSDEIVAKPQVGPVSYHTRKQTEQDRILDASTSLTVEDFMRWALAHDFSPGTTAEVRFQERTYKLTLSIEEKAGG